MFWPPMAEERFRALLEQGDIEEARAMLSRAAAGLAREDGAAGQE